MALDHDALAYGDFAALGEDFYPAAVELEHPAPVPLSGPPPSWKLCNELPVPLAVCRITAQGRRLVVGKLSGGSLAKPKCAGIEAPDTATYTYVIVHAVSGAYVTGFNAAAKDTKVVGPSSLRDPNNPGLPSQTGALPTPQNSGSPIPADSPPVLVGAGELKGHILAREQHWQKSADSYSLPPCSAVVSTVTESSGVTKSSNSMDKIATAVTGSAKAGWGPISASISASLSRSSTTTQQLSVTASTEATVIRELRNGYQVGLVVFMWQLVDRLLILAPAPYPIKLMLQTLQSPAIPMAYTPAGDPFPPPNVKPCVKSNG